MNAKLILVGIGMGIWFYLPYAINRAFRAEISWREVPGFAAYLIRAELGTVSWFCEDAAVYVPRSGQDHA